jgi:hypothetical protein
VIDTVLGTKSEKSRSTAKRFRRYLLDHLELPARVTGIEDFPWEEAYVFGVYSDKEYEAMKRDNPSFTDEFDLLDIEDPDEHDDCQAKTRRVADGKVFLMGLSWLEAVDKDSDTYRLLDAYSKWHCNY